MSGAPPVTVILPAHNAEATIAPAIASTLAQTYTDFELWVLENGSTDGTAAVARSFPDPRVRVFELGPVGFQGALQYAIENASSEWLARMDADDLMFPTRLESQMELLAGRPELVLVGAEYALLTPFGHIFERVSSLPSREVTAATLSRGRFFADPSTIFRRRVALEAGGVDPEFTMGDVPLWFRLLSRGPGWEIARPLHLYRIHPKSMSKASAFSSEGVRVRAKYAPGHRDRWASMKERESDSTGWYSIAALELLARDGEAVREAAGHLAAESARAAQRFLWASRCAGLGYRLYRWKNPSRYQYRHRPDWEAAFAPSFEPGHELRPSDARPSYARRIG